MFEDYIKCITEIFVSVCPASLEQRCHVNSLPEGDEQIWYADIHLKLKNLLIKVNLER